MKRPFVSSLLTAILLFSEQVWAVPLFSNLNTVNDLQQRIAALPKEGKQRQKAVLYTDLGSIQYEAGQYSNAINSFELALQGKTNQPLRKHIYLYLGKSFESSGRLDKAIEAYQQAVQYDRKNWKRHRDLGKLLEQIKLYDRALDSYKKALKYNHHEPSLYVDLGRSWRKYGRYERAEDFLNQAKQRGASGNDLDREFTLIYENQGRWVDAANQYARTLEPSSSFQDWARLLYLSRLANDQAYVEQSLQQMRSKPEAQQSLDFYEELVELYSDSPARVLTLDIHNPTLKNLVTSMAAESSNK